MIEEIVNGLVLKPEHDFYQGGNNIQIVTTSYRGVGICWKTIFWWNIFKDPSDTISIDYVLPDTTEVENGWIEEFYCPEGYGHPCFRTLEHAVEFIINYKNHIQV